MKITFMMIIAVMATAGCSHRIPHENAVTVKIRKEFVSLHSESKALKFENRTVQFEYFQWTYEPETKNKYRNSKPKELAKDAADDVGGAIIGQIMVSAVEALGKGLVELSAYGVQKSVNSLFSETDYRISISNHMGESVFHCGLGYNSFIMDERTARILSADNVVVLVSARGVENYEISVVYAPCGNVKFIDIDCNRDGKMRINGEIVFTKNGLTSR